ncbi:hypothetical protein [Winogradskyella sp.]|uniref:hypothetical protein n=1 Tax=Winogradskyella sp. TaxID=1883156 RepID=UPI003BA91B7A
MRVYTVILILLLVSCQNSKDKGQNKASDGSEVLSSVDLTDCDYRNEFKAFGNKVLDTIRIDGRLIDPLDDLKRFDLANFGFFTKEGRIFKKSGAIRPCGELTFGVEFLKEFTDQIDLTSYFEYDDRFFSTKGTVNFWWVNSDGHFIIPVADVDPKSFEPFNTICGGTDKNGVYYGSPNFDVHKLDIPANAKYTFIAKKNNFWNAPEHFVVVDDKVYDILHDINKGYFLKRNDSVLKHDILKQTDLPQLPPVGKKTVLTAKKDDLAIALTIESINQTTIQYKIEMVEFGKASYTVEGEAGFHPEFYLGTKDMSSFSGKTYHSIEFRDTKDSCYTYIRLGIEADRASLLLGKIIKNCNGDIQSIGLDDFPTLIEK